jgi:cytochrome b subunit of formate dehydrogenase
MFTKHTRPLMLIYSVAFLALCMHFTAGDKQVNIPFFLSSALIYVFASIGNFVYALRIPLGAFKKYWIVVPFFVVAKFFAEIVLITVDPEVQPRLWIVFWLSGLALYFPTFWANFSIALRKGETPLDDSRSLV